MQRRFSPSRSISEPSAVKSICALKAPHNSDRARPRRRGHRIARLFAAARNDATGRLCCKSRKLQGYEYFAKIQHGQQSPIRITSIALPKSPVSFARGDEVPHIFTRNARLQPAEFLIIGAKRLLQHNRHIATNRCVASFWSGNFGHCASRAKAIAAPRPHGRGTAPRPERSRARRPRSCGGLCPSS